MNRKEKRLAELEKKDVKTPKDWREMRKIVEKLSTQTKKVKQPEEEVAEANTLDAKNLYRFLVFLRNIYPIGSSFKQIKEKMKLDIFLESQLDKLIRDDIIIKRNFVVDEKFKKYINQDFLKGFPEYTITTKGMEFVHSIEVRDLSKNIEWLTKILIVFGAITIFIMITQVFPNLVLTSILFLILILLLIPKLK